MDSSRLADLYEAFKNFCEQLYKVRVYDETNVRDLFDVFSEMLKKTWYLPLKFMEDDVENTVNELKKKLKSEMTRDNPTYYLHHVHEATGRDLNFDKLESMDEIKDLVGGPYTAIVDMYPEITGGMLLYENGYTEYAFLDWSKGYHFHWNFHIRDAILDLHRMCRILDNKESQRN